jgi:hypothetical protein
MELAGVKNDNQQFFLMIQISMRQENYKSYKGNNIKGTSFSPCATDGLWSVSRWDVLHTNTGKRAVYFFGSDATNLALYKQSDQDLSISELIYDTLVRELGNDNGNGDFKLGEFRFEFDGKKFIFCKDVPRWASYDCGTIEE